MRALALLLAVVTSFAVPAAADTLTVAAAGSLTDAMSDLLRRFPRRSRYRGAT